MAKSKQNKRSSILWNLAGFKKNVIEKCAGDQYHASIIGLLLIMVGIYAVLAWTFFFQTVTDNIFLALLGGLFLGAFIVSLDRALIASLASGKANKLSLLFRLGLALLLGVFLSQPIILKLYQPEIKREAQILLDQKNLERKTELEKQFNPQIEKQKSQISLWQAEMKNKEEQLLMAENDFKQEMDGSAGTGKWGYSVVAKQKEKIYQKHLAEWEEMQKNQIPKMEIATRNIDSIESHINSEMKLYAENNLKTGTLIQVAALQAVLDKDESGALKSRYILLSLILILIELSALIAKLLFKMESYKKMMMAHTEDELENLMSERKLKKQRIAQFEELALKRDLKTQEAFINEADETINSGMKEVLQDWKTNPEGSLKSSWKKIVEKLLFG
mgnify:CR=1 FL=1|tara:strand:- start:157 stop:1323 length:1167 start_codon:yes stop_codon:yes gene_type:complete